MTYDRAELTWVAIFVELWVDDLERVMGSERHGVGGHAAPRIIVGRVGEEGVAVGEEDIRAKLALEAEITFDVGCFAVDFAKEGDGGDGEVPWFRGCGECSSTGVRNRESL